jgi:hypothetical protein
VDGRLGRADGADLRCAMACFLVDLRCGSRTARDPRTESKWWVWSHPPVSTSGGHSDRQIRAVAATTIGG